MLILASQAIHHRDIEPNNIFLHYPLPSDPEEPEDGYQENAFPEVILGGFAHGAVADDDPRRIQPGRFDDYAVQDWHDAYSIGATVYELCLAHIPYDELDEGSRPYKISCMLLFLEIVRSLGLLLVQRPFYSR
jgi:serine/threonine protein kinase